MSKGFWIVLSGSGGELDRKFVAGGEDALQAEWPSVVGSWVISDGDTIHIQSGESETD